ncbi:hypothetical protein Goklo_012062, partial [Gossypium klotzschianum]|nr:hypothetical protein [Gossypium klotzschianum]
MSLDPIEAELGEGLPSNVIDDDEPNIINIRPSNTWATWRMKLANQMFYKWQASRNILEEVALVACMVDLYNVGTYNAYMRFKDIERDWEIFYNMFSGKDNSEFGWDKHRQMVVAKDAKWNSYINPVNSDIAISLIVDQLTSIYAKDRATKKYAQTA